MEKEEFQKRFLAWAFNSDQAIAASVVAYNLGITVDRSRWEQMVGPGSRWSDLRNLSFWREQMVGPGSRSEQMVGPKKPKFLHRPKS